MKTPTKKLSVPRNHVVLASMKRGNNGAGSHTDTKYNRKEKYTKDWKNSKNWNQ